MTMRVPHKDETFSEDQNAAEYLARHEKGAGTQFKAFLKDFHQLNPEGHFLEIGPGPGFLTAKIAEKKPLAQITALEPSPEMIYFAEAYLQEKGVGDNVRFIQGSIEDREVVESLGRFDFIYSTFSLHHWANPELALRHLMGRLNQTGTLFIHDLKRVSWLYYLPLGNGLFESVRAAYTKVEIISMLMSMGIGEKEITFKNPFPYFWFSLLIKNA